MNNDASKIDIPECRFDDSFFENIDLFINIGYDLPRSFIAKFRKKVFVDTDSGQTQVWMFQFMIIILLMEKRLVNHH